MAAWRGGQIERLAPVVDAKDVPALIGEAVEKGLLAAPAARGQTPLANAEAGVFGGARVAPASCRTSFASSASTATGCVSRAGSCGPNRGWQLQEAPVLLPSHRFTQALASAAGKGVLASDSPAEQRPS